MIVVDSSCLLAILQNEREKRAFEVALASDGHYVMSAVNAHEAACVMRGRHGVAGVARLWDLIAAAEIEIVAFDELQVRVAAAASIVTARASIPKRLSILPIAPPMRSPRR